MANRRDYVFTHHLRERFLQRTEKKYKHLYTCKEHTCEICRNLVMEINEKLHNRRLIDREIARRLDQAIECRGCLNDARFMQWYYEKYGTDKKFEFLVDEDICFVVIHDEGKKIIVTCVWSRTHAATRQVLRPKFKKKKQILESLPQI